MTEKKEMTVEEEKFRYENMYMVEEYKTFLHFTGEGNELHFLLFNIYYQLTRIADKLKEEVSPVIK